MGAGSGFLTSFGMRRLKLFRKQRQALNVPGKMVDGARLAGLYVVARMTERPGANASPTSPWPATSRLARPSGAIFTMPRVPESEAAT